MSSHAFTVTHSSSVPNWRTEAELFAALDREFKFVLDAAASRVNRLTRAYFGPDHSNPLQRDALILGDWKRHGGSDSHPGHGAIFCNPPSSRDEGMSLQPWMAKFVEQAGIGATIVGLIPHKTSSAYWRHCRRAVEIREIPHRVKYWLPADELEVINAARAAMIPPKKPLKSGDSAGFDSAVVIWRPQPGILQPASPRVVTWSYRPKPFTGTGAPAARQGPA